jgi:hypothetical protein
MPKPRIFISHISEEAELAKLLKSRLSSDFLGMIDVFVSSDTESVLAGSNWLTSIDTALREAHVEIVLCSPVSVKRPWINFEAGAGWMRGIPIIPLCHSGLVPRSLPMPLAVLQAVAASDTEGIKQVYAVIAKALDSTVPQSSVEEVIAEVVAFEREYQERLPVSSTTETERDVQILRRLREALEDPAHRFRSLKWLAILSGVSEGEAADLLRRDSDVVFSTGKSGRLIARLRWR